MLFSSLELQGEKKSNGSHFSFCSCHLWDSVPHSLPMSLHANDCVKAASRLLCSLKICKLSSYLSPIELSGTCIWIHAYENMWFCWKWHKTQKRHCKMQDIKLALRASLSTSNLSHRFYHFIIQGKELEVQQKKWDRNRNTKKQIQKSTQL